MPIKITLTGEGGFNRMIEEITEQSIGKVNTGANEINSKIKNNYGTFMGGNITPLKDSTIDKKGHNRPLIDTGEMVGDISVIEKASKMSPKAIVGFRSSKEEDKAIIHEFGNGVVARPYWYLTMRSNRLKKELEYIFSN